MPLRDLSGANAVHAIVEAYANYWWRRSRTSVSRQVWHLSFDLLACWKKWHLPFACLPKEVAKDTPTKRRNFKGTFKKDPKMKTTPSAELAKKLKISKSRGLEAVLKAELIDAVLKASKSSELTHAEIAKKSGLPRSAVTGILAGSLQKVTLDRILKLVEAVGLTAELRVKKAA